MKLLLGKVAGTFTKPTCRFVVSGFYPILSPRSDFDIFDEFAVLDHLLGLHGLGFPLHLDRGPVIDQIVKLSMQFWRESDVAISQAVSETAALNALGNRMIFAPNPFTEENALFAGAPWLWGFNKSLQPEDEVIAGRKEGCRLQYGDPLRFMERELCGYASLGHPNVTGAQQIGRAILQAM